METKWRASTWGEEISLEYGKSLRDYNKTHGAFRVFGSNGPIGWTDKALAPGPGVILGRKGACRGTEYSPKPFFVIDTAYYVVPKTDLDMRWLYYAIKYHKLGEIDDGSPIPSTTRAAVYVRDLNVPPISEQKRIASILGTIDDKIELNRNMNETLEQIARTLFKSWFVDFDPVHAKAAGRQPDGMDRATADLFPDSFSDSELGKIPSGWKAGTLDELVEPRVEKVAATPDKDMTRYIALEDMPSKSLELSQYQLGSAVNSSIIRFRKGDILFGSMRVYFHKVGLAYFDGITRTTTFVFKPRKELMRHFSLLHLFSDEVIAFATTASIGTTIPYVRWDSLRQYRLTIPPDELLSRFDEIVRNLTSKIATHGQESRMLTELRDSLLPRLISGELSIKSYDTSA